MTHATLIAVDALEISRLQDQFITVKDAVAWYAREKYGHHCKCAADLDDMIQTAMLTAWQYLPKFDSSKGSLSGWVCRAARFGCIEFFRSRDNFPKQFEDTTNDDGTLKVKGGAISLVEARPEYAATVDEKREKIGRFLATLSGNEFIVLEGRLSGLTLKEIAHRLGTTRQWASQLLERVLNKLRKDYANV